MSTTNRLDLRRLLPVGRHGWLLRRPGFTADEVRALLRAGGADERGRAVQRCLARPGDWLCPPPNPRECPTRYQRLLPRIAFWYARGDSCAAIAMRMGGHGSAWGVERALELVCRRMAACLNQTPADYGLGRE
jgi:hypothetical protein